MVESIATLGLCKGLAKELRTEALGLRPFRWMPPVETADFDAPAAAMPIGIKEG